MTARGPVFSLQRVCGIPLNFIALDLGDIDLEQKTLQPLDNPLRPLVSPMRPEHSVPHVFGMYPENMVPPEGLEPPTP